MTQQLGLQDYRNRVEGLHSQRACIVYESVQSDMHYSVVGADYHLILAIELSALCGKKTWIGKSRDLVLAS